MTKNLVLRWLFLCALAAAVSVPNTARSFGPIFSPVRTQSLALGVDGAWSPTPGSEEGGNWLVGARGVYAVQESYTLIPQWWWGLSVAGHRHLGADRWRISGAGMVGLMSLGLEVGGYADLRDGESHGGAFVGLGLTMGLATLYARQAVYASDGAPFTHFGVRLQAPYVWKKRRPSWLGRLVLSRRQLARERHRAAAKEDRRRYARGVELVSWEIGALAKRRAQWEKEEPKDCTVDNPESPSCEGNEGRAPVTPKLQKSEVRLPPVRLQIRLPGVGPTGGAPQTLKLMLEGRPRTDASLKGKRLPPRLRASWKGRVAPGEITTADLKLVRTMDVPLEALSLEWSLVARWFPRSGGMKMWTTHRPLCDVLSPEMAGGGWSVSERSERCLDLPQPKGDLKALRDVLLSGEE